MNSTPDDKAESLAEDFLSAFGAGDILDHPGEPPRDVASPADDTDILPPG